MAATRLPSQKPMLQFAAFQRCGAVAQLGERLVRNEKVRSSILLGSTNFQALPVLFTFAVRRPGRQIYRFLIRCALRCISPVSIRFTLVTNDTWFCLANWLTL
jgi:hypothetical protein